MDSIASISGVCRASQLLEEPAGDDPLQLEALRGQISEFVAEEGHPTVSLAVERLADAHRAGEPAGWIGGKTSLFYPPDAARFGLDWSALAVLRLDDAQSGARAADKLLRSGAFGVVVLDLTEFDEPAIPPPLAGRLVRLARSHDTAAVVLSRRPDHSLSSRATLRVRAGWRATGTERMQMCWRVVEDKHRGPGDDTREVWDGALRLR